MPDSSTHDTVTIPLTFRLARGWRWLWFTLLGVLLYQFFTLQRPGFGELGPLFRGQIWAYLRALFGYYVLFELVSVFIFLRLATRYVRQVGMDRIELTPGGVLRHQLRFLPFVLGVILVFGPITNGLRYLAVFYPDYSWATYFPEYFFTARMYVNYLLPFLIFGYSILNINLFLDYNDWQHARFARLTQGAGIADNFLKTVEARDDEGETLLAVGDVLWFEVEGKNYQAFTLGKTYSIRKTLSELEAELDPAQFFRVNRAVIVNLAHLKNYSFWENDKYILRLSDDKTTFVMQRMRLKELRRRLGG
jgi:two-component system LytT family response regulator